MEFEEMQAHYVSGSQRARAWTERWVADWIYCPNCGNSNIQQFPSNRPLADFFCDSCQEQYELKSQRKAFGEKVIDGTYHVNQNRLTSSENPNLLLINCNSDRREVTNVCIVSKHFFVPDIIEKRKPLAQTARRAGWIGSNILLGRIPEAGKIFYVREGRPEPKDEVSAHWKRTLFLRENELVTKGWAIEVLRCIENIGKLRFGIDDVYKYENHLQSIYPGNRNINPKIRQQLQVLRDSGLSEFLGGCSYKLRYREQN